MTQRFINLVLIISVLFAFHTAAYASWGWEPTDDPVPYYHQAWGKWYIYDDTKVFMVQLDDLTYKYVFDYNDTFLGGWITYMPIRLP